jgi:hypothetical protein
VTPGAHRPASRTFPTAIRTVAVDGARIDKPTRAGLAGLGVGRPNPTVSQGGEW